MLKQNFDWIWGPLSFYMIKNVSDSLLMKSLPQRFFYFSGYKSLLFYFIVDL